MVQLGMTVLLVVYSVMLFGTFIETGAGMLQGINERIDAFLIEKRGGGLSRISHAVIAIFAILISAMLSLWGITNLLQLHLIARLLHVSQNHGRRTIIKVPKLNCTLRT